MPKQVCLYDLLDRETSLTLLTDLPSREEARDAKRELEVVYGVGSKIRQRKYRLVDEKVIR